MPSKELINLINELKIVKMTLQKEKPKFLKIERYKCETNNGKILYREKLLKNNNNGSASIILPITTNNKVILTVQPRVFTSLTVGISLPAGYLF